MSDPDHRRYAQRVLNPFQGVVQILETSQARALSTDGLSWRIQVSSEIYKQPWSSLAIPTQYERYFVYGRWSRKEGLARVPVHPSLYQEHVEQSAAELISLLNASQDHLPYPLTDHIELWLFNNIVQQPVALLGSCHSPQEISPVGHLAWYATSHADTGFISETFATEQQHASTPLPAQVLLERLVHRHCGHPHSAYWIERTADGSGTILQDHSGDKRCRGQSLAAALFPECLLTEQWPDPQSSQLVADYHAWQAPRLLMLPLSVSRRRCLEQQSASQPMQVHQHHRLYPQVADADLLRKILVEAVMRQSSMQQK